VRGDRITIDRRSGDLRSAGAARSTLTLATGRSQSRSALLSYTDRDRTIRYQGDESGPVQLSGPDGDLRAGRIAVVLAATGNRVEHVEAETGVTLKLDTRTATGSHLTYRATDERYVMTGTGRTPVTIVEPCRETTGSTLTFHKSADQIVIEGNQAARTQSVRGQHCSEPRPR
jgi:lipopolysaccharide export system protein LptA